eukprot:1153381-Pelagomonas_calceolata.AAC.1
MHDLGYCGGVAVSTHTRPAEECCERGKRRKKRFFRQQQQAGGSTSYCLMPLRFAWYLDAHGEEDPELRRGRPLYLQPSIYAHLSKLWSSAALDYDSITPYYTTAALWSAGLCHWQLVSSRRKNIHDIRNEVIHSNCQLTMGYNELQWDLTFSQ